ncbi:MAG: hypothetical protein ABI690_13895 [Chloroflexota bacterium]
MGKRPFFVLFVLVALAACDPGQSDRRGNGPQLIEDVTLAPTTPEPTRVLSPTPSPLMIPVMTSTGSSELVSPLEVSTLDADFILVTPTLPPSKTPTLTPTVTSTFTRTPPATVTPNYPYVPDVPVVGGIDGVVPIPTAITNIQPQTSNCIAAWFFAQVHPADCALNPPLTSLGAFLQFQNGFMIWVQQQDAIYVLYDSANFPRWQVFNDAWVDGIPDSDPTYANPPAYTWQPKRGFGLLWRNQSALRERLGWSVMELETPFDAQVQIGSNGTIYINEPRGGIFVLTADGSEWKRFE